MSKTFGISSDNRCYGKNKAKMGQRRAWIGRSEEGEIRSYKTIETWSLEMVWRL